MKMGDNIETFAPDVSSILEHRVCSEACCGQGIPLIDNEECLVERKWWCFLLSSIFTFLLGLLSVILTRLAQAYLCQVSDHTATHRPGNLVMFQNFDIVLFYINVKIVKLY